MIPTYTPPSYVPNGVTTVFTIPWPYQDTSHIKVYIDDVLVGSAAYAVSTPSTTGTVTFTAAPTGSTLKIYRQVPFDQETDFQNQTSFKGKRHEDAYDRAAMQAADLDERINRLSSLSGSISGTVGRVASFATTSSIGNSRLIDGVAIGTLQFNSNAVTNVNNVITFQNFSAQTVAALNVAQAFTAVQSFPDANLNVVGSSDATKIFRFEVDGFTTGVTRTWTVPDRSDTFAGLATQTFTGTQTFSTATLFSDGSLANPAMAFSSATSTGWYKPAAGQVGLSLSGSQILLITATSIGFNRNTVYPTSPTNPIARFVGADSSAFRFSLESSAAQTRNVASRSEGTAASPSAMSAAVITDFAVRGYGTTAWSAELAYLELRSTSAWTDTNNELEHRWYTVPNASVTRAERIRLYSDGGWQLGGTYGTSPGAGVVSVAGGVTLQDAANVVAGTTTGAKIGTATTQKIGFWNTTPVVQPAGAAQAAAAAQGQQTLTDSTGGSASTTLAAITAGAAYAQADMTAAKNAIASLAAQLALIKTDVTNIKTLEDAIRTALVNTGLIKGAA